MTRSQRSTTAPPRSASPGLPAEASEEASIDQSVASVLERLRATGGRATTARRLLLRSLFSQPRHQTAEELAAAVQAGAPDVHLSTVYRNLEELERLGVVSHVHLGHGPATYHVSPTAHGHLVCEECGEVTEIDEHLFDPLAETILAEHGFVIDRHHFALLGRCATCGASESSASSPN